MDEKKVAFILCVNDETKYTECKNYLDRLIIPEGYTTDIMAVLEAPSMAAGYNAGMQSTDAAYKIYLHQDVFIINRHFVRDMLNVFAEDRQIGIMGCIGASHLDEYARAVTDWDTGKILHNCTPPLMEFEAEKGICTDVEAVDGLLIATHGDIPWREDLFDGWDYYDISQCMEYKRAGFRCVVPRQEKPWCYHDNSYSKMRKYYDYSLTFAKEYGDIKPFIAMSPSETSLQLAESKERTRAEMEMLVDMGRFTQIETIFSKEENRGWLHLREYQVLSDINVWEEETDTEIRFWNSDFSAAELLQRIRRIKYLLKRLEYDGFEAEEGLFELCADYSVCAIAAVYLEYVVYREKVYDRILLYYQKKRMKKSEEYWKKMGSSVL